MTQIDDCHHAENLSSVPRPHVVEEPTPSRTDCQESLLQGQKSGFSNSSLPFPCLQRAEAEDGGDQWLIIFIHPHLCNKSQVIIFINHTYIIKAERAWFRELPDCLAHSVELTMKLARRRLTSSPISDQSMCVSKRPAGPTVLGHAAPFLYGKRKE